MTDDDREREKCALKILARLHHYTLAEHYEDHVNDIRVIADALKDAAEIAHDRG